MTCLADISRSTSAEHVSSRPAVNDKIRLALARRPEFQSDMRVVHSDPLRFQEQVSSVAN